MCSKTPICNIPDSEKFRKWLVRSSEALNISMYLIGKKAGVGPNTVKNFASGATKGMELETASKISSALAEFASAMGVQIPCLDDEAT